MHPTYDFLKFRSISLAKPSVQNNGNLVSQNEQFACYSTIVLNYLKKNDKVFMCFKPCFAITQNVSNVIKSIENVVKLCPKYATERLL